ncbi:hypothetical protein SEA_FRIBS8_12 [Gordonia phage Fribs8]|nr:hypothetical protein SEA_FRIBS8_12 [Gordonia phage Fribs8]
MAKQAGRVTLNNRGFRKVRSFPKLVREIDRITGKMADDANSYLDDDGSDKKGYQTSSVEGAARPQGRHRGTVITATQEAIEDNAENNRLLKVMMNVRGR